MTGSAQEIPIVGARASLLVNGVVASTGVSNAAGRFSLDNIRRGDSYVLKIQASVANAGPGGAKYSDFIEPLHLIEGVDNRVARPFFLPRIDMSSATAVVADRPTQVMNSNLKVGLSIPANAVVNTDGTVFTGDVTISQVPKNLAPISLPEQFNPSMLITIQPAGIEFSTPAQISFPNDMGLRPGDRANIYSIDPDSGAFVVTGVGQVNASGDKIETISGGIRGATWHFVIASPAGIEVDAEVGNQDCSYSGCIEGSSSADCLGISSSSSGCPDIGSSSPLSEGFLLETFNLVGYRSLGQLRGLRLSYNSGSASPRPIIGATIGLPRSVLSPRFISAKIRVGGEEKPGTIYTDTDDMDELIGENMRQKVIYDASELATGIYSYDLLITSHFAGEASATGIVSGDSMVVNQGASDFGAGWSLSGHHQLYQDLSGNVMLRSGNSAARMFAKQEGGSFLSPAGDYSVLVKEGSGYVRTLKNGLRYTFNADGLLAHIKDRNNNITLYCYVEGSERLKYIEDPTGRRTHFVYNAAGKVTRITGPAGRATEMAYDGSGNLVTITNPDSSVRRFQYDGEHRLVGKVMENGMVSNYGYDGFGRVSSNIISGGGSVSVRPAAIHGLEGLAVDQGSMGSPLGVLLPEDESGRFTDKNGNVDAVRVNSFGAVIEHRNALGQRSQVVRDENNNPTTTVDALRRRVFNRYDSKGNLTQSWHELSRAVTRYSYEATFNQVSAVLDALGNRTAFSYDSRGNLLQVTDANGGAVKFTYNIAGQVETQIDAMGGVSRFFYHHTAGHLRERIDPNGNVTRFSYDDAGNVLKVVDGKGNITAFEYDLMNRVTKSVDAGRGETLFRYDVSGNLVGLTDAKGNVTSFSYDQENRLVSRRNPRGQEERFVYDNEGNLIEQIDRKKQSIKFRYDVLNRLVEKNLGNDSVAYSYDAVGNLLRVVDGDSTLTYRYDSRNQVSNAYTFGSSNQPSVTLSYSYDRNGNKTAFSAPFSRVSYQYDVLNRQVKLIAGTKSFSFTYDANSRLKSRGYPNGVSAQYGYDSASRLLDIKHSRGGSDLLGLGYSYDKADNRIQKRANRPGLPLSTELSYSYDSLNRLVSATRPQQNLAMETFVYDGVGNRLQRDGERQNSLFGANNELMEDSTYRYVYDDNGNLVRKVHKTSGEIIKYSWDRENRLVRIEEYLNDTAALSKEVSYRYDGLGRRIEKRVQTSIGIDTVRYVYDGEDIVAEYSVRSQIEAYYVHGQGIDVPLSMVRDNRHYYYHQDGLNSIAMLTDSSGTPVQHYAYDAYGSISTYSANGLPAMGNSLIKNPYTFTGREYDEESGLYYFRARLYSPTSGRFLSEEPLGIDGPNLYWYALNNPMNFIDPTGLFGFALQTSGAFGASNRPEASTGSVVEVSSGFAVSVEEGGVVAKGIISAGTGSQIRGITGGAGLSITIFGGDVSTLGGAGTAETTVVGIFSFTKLKNDKGKTVGYSLGTPFGKGLGFARFTTDTRTKLGSIFNIGGNKTSCPLQR